MTVTMPAVIMFLLQISTAASNYPQVKRIIILSLLIKLLM